VVSILPASFKLNYIHSYKFKSFISNPIIKIACPANVKKSQRTELLDHYTFPYCLHAKFLADVNIMTKWVCPYSHGNIFNCLGRDDYYVFLPTHYYACIPR